MAKPMTSASWRINYGKQMPKKHPEGSGFDFIFFRASLPRLNKSLRWRQGGLEKSRKLSEGLLWRKFSTFRDDSKADFSFHNQNKEL